MVFFSYKIKKMIAFKWMGERKQEPPWGGIKQLNFPLLSASPTTSLSGKGHRTLQQNLSQTRCTTALGHDMLPQPPQRAHDLWPDRSQAWVCRWQARTNEDREQVERSARYNSGPNETEHRWAGWVLSRGTQEVGIGPKVAENNPLWTGIIQLLPMQGYPWL